MERKINFKKSKKGIRVYSESKVLSSDFRKWVLCKLIEHYDLYEHINDENRYLSAEIIERSARLSEDEISDYRSLYRREKIDYIEFNEFLEIFKILFGDIYVYRKNTFIDQNYINGSNVAIIYLEDDGDWNSIWIEVFHQDFELCLLKLIEEYNLIHET